MSEQKTPDTLAEAFDEYRQKALQGDVPPFLVEMLEQTFYAGAHSVFVGMFSEDSAEAGRDSGKRMMREVTAYQESAALRHCSTEGSA